MCVCVRTGVDLPVSLQGFFCLELGATLVTNDGLLTGWTTSRNEKADAYYTHTHTHVTHLEKKTARNQVTVRHITSQTLILKPLNIRTRKPLLSVTPLAIK